jgi:hypothetical protein
MVGVRMRDALHPCPVKHNFGSTGNTSAQHNCCPSFDVVAHVAHASLNYMSETTTRKVRAENLSALQPVLLTKMMHHKEAQSAVVEASA